MTNLETSLHKKGRRPNSVAVIGALFGDEGKGRITDELTNYFLKNFGEVITYRDNGGSNAGHTVSVGDKSMGLHQVGSGILQKGSTVILGKGMVIHPIDLIEELNEVKRVFELEELPAKFMIDEMACLNLDTHRAFEEVLKGRGKSKFTYKAATGRGISPSYADVLHRNPVRIRDLISDVWKEKFSEHYQLYSEWIKGMGADPEKIHVNRFNSKPVLLGSKDEFLSNLEQIREEIKEYISPMFEYITKHWESETPFIFEKAQGVGVEYRWGAYPDVSCSDCTVYGITYSTEGAVIADDISSRIGVIKSTYTSSVGSRNIPTFMEDKLAKKIRDDANEYGTTTGRPRDIAYLDLLMLRYFCKVGGIEGLAYTHMDIVYDEPVKVCIEYMKDGKKSYYRPDQLHLNDIEPKYKEFKPWDSSKFMDGDIPKEAQTFMDYISDYTDTTPAVITYGPKRHDTLVV
ncbi:MAG: Adenylosuccinate synthetase [candidate division WS6 bacterium 34_10]|uniref:Adenylosuccinate synthetase n=1 Tax=candidate division WS6 bacterium 34_10 TaxID=1641389 RepID=A0A101HI92_9BACT|nr:MAG: Adenylosuccinate synthetase [candidate division WS6 bacterium 34_10]